MAYRQPTSSICLLKGCPCDPEYNNSVWYTSRQEQFNGNGTNKGLIRLCEHVWYNGQTFQRKGRNSFRINVPESSIYNYLEFNYVIFSNAHVALNDNSTITKQSRLFYAFIDTLEYVNDNTVEFSYTIDYFQTYMFDYRLGNCFIEREHSQSDNLYEHLESEPFAPNDYTYWIAGEYNHSDLYILIKYVPNTKIITDWYYPNYATDPYTLNFNTLSVSGGGAGYGTITNKTYSGTCFVSFPLYFATSTAVQATQNNIQSCLNTIDVRTAEIVEISVVPAEICPHDTTIDGSNITHYWEFYTDRIPDTSSWSYSSDKTVSRFSVFRDSKGNTYTPKNNKLYNYPFCSLYMTNEQGETQELFWENFSTNTANFVEKGVKLGSPELSLIPKNYNNKVMALENKISFQNFPTCPWSVDSASSYWQQNKGQITANIVSSLLAWGLGTSVTKTLSGGIYNSYGSIGLGNISEGNSIVPYGGPIVPYGSSGGSDFISGSITNSYTQLSPHYTVNQSLLGIHGQTSLLRQVGMLYDLANRPDHLYGAQTFSQMPILNSAFGFKVFHKYIKPYEAKIIDDYFSAFGYSCKKLKVPNIYTSTGTKRPSWYYIKNSYTRVEPHVNASTTQIDGYVNAEVDNALQAIYNKGITIWFDSADVGDYSLDNSPIT